MQIFELMIKDQVFEFEFGMRFLRDLDNTIVKKDGNGVAIKYGYLYSFAGLLDHDLESLIEVLKIANKGHNPRITDALLYDFIDDESTDLNEVFDKVMDFLKSQNATKGKTEQVVKTLTALAEQNGAELPVKE